MLAPSCRLAKLAGISSTALVIFAASSVISASPSSLRSAGRLLRRLAGKASTADEKSVAHRMDAFMLATETIQRLRSVCIGDG